MAVAADIVKVEAPSSAASGATVIVDVSVKNIASTNKYLAATGVYDSSSLSWQFDYLIVLPQETVVFRGYFYMPSKKVTVTVNSWYWDGSKWVLDEEQSLSIALTELAPQFSELKISSFSKV